jgi:hypothetical protein
VNLRTVFIFGLITLGLCAATPPEARAATFNLSDFGAVGDGVADDGPALQRALDALAAAGGGTLIVPAGRFAIITPVSKDFTGKAYSITVSGIESSTPMPPPSSSGAELAAGLDLVSEFLPQTGASGTAINITGLQTFLIKDISFTGTPDVPTDATITLALNDIWDATIQHCEFYALASMVPGGAIVQALRSHLKINQTKFLGSFCASGHYTSVVQNLEWKGITITDVAFVDYGLRSGSFGKSYLAAAFSWVSIGNAAAPHIDSPRREAVFRNVFLDEGAYFGLTSLPFRFPPSAPIDLVYITGLYMNVSNFGTTGHYFYGPERVLIEKSRYGWSHYAHSAIALTRIGNTILDEVECVEGADQIVVDPPNGKLIVINSVYGGLQSPPESTKVINTAPENDLVQHVRRQFLTLLGRDPDAAAHFYWSNRLLECAENTQCVTSEREALLRYLNTQPSANFSVSGRVTDETGAALAGATIRLTGSQSVTTLTEADGSYRFSKLPTSGVYVLIPNHIHYTFDTPSKTITTPEGNQQINFGATLNRHTLRGRITTSGAQSVANVTVTLSGSQNGATTTDANGDWVFPNIPAGGNYTVTPSQSTFVFSPATNTVQDLSADRTFNFTLVTYQISGRVHTGGVGVSGATVNLSGFQSSSITTDAGGNYSFANLAAGQDYSLTVSKTSHTFTPSSIALEKLDSNKTADFSVVLIQPTITGRVTVGPYPIPAVSVGLSGSQTASTLTNSNGSFSFVVVDSGNYTLTLTDSRYAFIPNSPSFNNVTSDVIANFTGKFKPGVPLLITEPTTTRGLVLDAVLWLKEPFKVTYDLPWSSDRRTRLMLFTTNFALQPGEAITAITADAEDESHRVYPLTVEYFGQVENVPWLSRVVVRLHDDLGAVGDVLIRITYRGVPGNRVRVGIGKLGGGPADDPGSFPIPNQAPN